MGPRKVGASFPHPILWICSAV